MPDTPDLEPDELQPGGKDPAEGARTPSGGAPAAEHPENSHLGEAGDPAEG